MIDEHETLVEAWQAEHIAGLKREVRRLQRQLAGVGIEDFWRHVSIIAEQVAW